MRTPTIESTHPRTVQCSFIAYCLERSTLLLAIKTALVVGTIVGLINHGQALLTGHLTPEHVLPICLTYLVPFSVSTFSQVKAKMQRDHSQIETSPGAVPQAGEATSDESNKNN